MTQARAFSYFKTKDGLEIDLIIQSPGAKDRLVEIKSADEIREEHAKTVRRLSLEWPRPCRAELWSRDPQEQKIKAVRWLPWKTALRKMFRPPEKKER